MGVPTHGMGMSQPAQELGQFAVLARPNHHVPVIRQNAVGEKTRGMLCHRLDHHAFKRCVILVLLEQRKTGDTTVQNVVNEASGSVTRTSGHVLA